MENTKDNLRTMIKSFEDLNQEASEMTEKINNLETENMNISNKFNAESLKNKNMQS